VRSPLVYAPPPLDPPWRRVIIYLRSMSISPDTTACKTPPVLLQTPPVNCSPPRPLPRVITHPSPGFPTSTTTQQKSWQPSLIGEAYVPRRLDKSRVNSKYIRPYRPPRTTTSTSMTETLLYLIQPTANYTPPAHYPSARPPPGRAPPSLNLAKAPTASFATVRHDAERYTRRLSTPAPRYHLGRRPLFSYHSPDSLPSSIPLLDPHPPWQSCSQALRTNAPRPVKSPPDRPLEFRKAAIDVPQMLYFATHKRPNNHLFPAPASHAALPLGSTPLLDNHSHLRHELFDTILLLPPRDAC